MPGFPSRIPEWVRWIPAVVLSILIAAVVAFALVGGPRLAAGPGPAETGEVDERNFSVFTAEGRAFIDEQRVPRLDLRELPVAAEPLGLPLDGELTIGPHPQNLDYRLVLLAAGGAGGARFTTPRFTLVTEAGHLRALRIVPPREAAAGAFRAVEAYALESAERFGFAPPEPGALLELVIAARETGEIETLSTATGSAIGLPAALEIGCGAEGLCEATIVVVVEPVA